MAGPFIEKPEQTRPIPRTNPSRLAGGNPLTLAGATVARATLAGETLAGANLEQPWWGNPGGGHLANPGGGTLTRGNPARATQPWRGQTWRANPDRATWRATLAGASLAGAQRLLRPDLPRRGRASGV